MSAEKVRTSLYQAIDEVNRLLPKATQLAKQEDTVLFGEGSPLDSVNLINLLVSFEDSLEKNLNRSVGLTTDQVILEDGRPLHSVRTLVTYVDENLLA